MNRHKYLFIIISALLLFIMIYESRRAGVSCDEVLHYEQSERVYSYFTSCGKDLSALNTPGTYLKYYGQSYDNIATILTKAFGIEDIYGFRNIMAAIAGWLTIILTALFAVWLAGFETGITVLLLFAVSPTFLGHSLNNLKDIPFALGYISGTFFIIKFLLSEKSIPVFEGIMLILSIAFCMSIRSGGMMLICYLAVFFILWEIIKIYKTGKADFAFAGKRLIVILFISILAWFLSLLLWPYGLQNPLVNPVKAHILMSRYPLTFREIFEGRVEWSDYMPWYYLIKYMVITIPLTVLAGIICIIFTVPEIIRKGKLIHYFLLTLTIIFPIIYVIYFRPNIYSGWRQFLFLYPGIVILSATGIIGSFKLLKNKYVRYLFLFLILILTIHPVKYLITDFRYAYIYYNPLADGVKGANGNYETDYYFTGQREAAEWLNKYLEQKGIKDTMVVGSNFSAAWYFRNNPLIKNIYFRNEERANYDWDYYLCTNRYILPWRLKQGLWPTRDALKIIYADGAPVCAVTERKLKDSYLGYRALQENRLKEAEHFFSKALKECNDDEMIFYNFAVTLNRERDSVRADSVLNLCLRVNQFFEPALMYAGKVSVLKGEYDKAEKYFEKLIWYNRKYFEAYISLAEIVGKRDVVQARSVLRRCLKVNPAYKPAILGMADLYRRTNPEIAAKYDSIAKRLK